MDDFLSPLEVTTDKYFYEVGEIIHITLTNVGLGPIEFMYYPWDQIIEDSDGNVVVDTRLCWLRLTVITPLPPGANESDVWGQRYLICEDFDEVPPSGEQVPSGKYEISVGLDDATYGGVYMPVWGSTWIEIGPADNPPVADAGPDQTVSVGDTVFFNGSGSHASVGEVIPLGDNFMINELRGLGGVGGVPQAVFDSDGNLHITWTDSTHKGGIYFDKAPYQGAFGTDVKVGDLFSTWSDIALGPNGDIHIAWWLGDIQYSVSTDGGLTFSSPIAISEANTPGGYPVRISTGPNGSVHVVWASISPSRICYRSSSDGGKKWDSGVVIAEGGFPDIAVSEDGSVYVTWQGLAEGSANASILFSRKSPDGVFEPKITVHPLGSFRHINPSIALGPNGEVLIAWMEYSDGEYRIAFARSVDGGLSFGTPIIVRAVKPDANPGIMRLVETAVTAFGSRGVAVAWIEYLEPFTQVAETRVSVSLNVGRTFSPYSRVDDFAEAGKRQAVIVGNAQGDFFAAWHDGRDCPSKGLCGSNIYGVWLEASPVSPLTFDWDFGDGSPHASGVNPTHIYDSSGIYYVSLTVTDEQGKADSDNCIITVLSRNQPPVAEAGLDQTVNEGDTVLFDGTGSFDPDGGGGEWLPRANIPNPRLGGGSATLDGEIYYVGGDTPDCIVEPTSIFQKYNPTTDSWHNLTDLPAPRYYLGSATVNGKIYAIGGSDGIYSTNTTFEFDPATETWTSRSPMPIPMEAFGTAVVNDRIHVVGGWSTFMYCYPCGMVFEYDPSTDSWTIKPDMPTPRAYLAVTVMEDRIYAIGGDSNKALGTVEVYDPTTETWANRANMTTARSRLSAESLGENIYAFGGVENPLTNVTEMYNPSEDSWTPGPSMLGERSDFGSGVVGDCIYAVGGGTIGFLPQVPNNTEEYCLGGELKYEWDFDASVDSDGDGNYTNDVEGTGSTPTHVYGDNGNYTVTLKVTDGSGMWDTDTCAVTVLNVAPTAYANGPYEGFEGSPIEFTGTRTDPGLSDIHMYEWDFDYDGMLFSPDATGTIVQKTWYDDHSGDIALKVTDDDGGWDMDVTTVEIRNVPPTADAGEDNEGYEVSTFAFDGSCYDPGIYDTHTYEWDFDYDGTNFDVDAVGQSVSHTWIDDFDGDVALRVTDDDGGVGMDTTHVLVKNVPPTVELRVLPIEVDVFLRIAGEKWHDVTIELYEDDVLIAEGTLTRYPGSPNDQMLNLAHLQVNISRRYSAIVRYTPEDDPINGQPNGANPCWIILRFDDQEEVWIHHTFNVQHPETHTWEVDLTAAILSHGLTFEATAYDPGADDLTFHWDFGDGTNITTFYPNANGTYPVEITEAVTHAFLGSGTFIVTLSVEDDDGGTAVASITITIP